MRFLIPILALVLAACSSDEAPAPEASSALPAGTYAGDGRDSLCVSGAAGGQRAGFVTYGSGDENCSVSGSLAQDGATWTLTPQGDADCRITLGFTDGTMSLGPVTPSCSYYCAPGASFAGKSFTESRSAKPATDFGGDPLC